MRRSTLAAGLLSALLTTAAHATPFLDINFDGDTAGSAPGTAPLSNPLIKPTAIGGYDPAYASPPTAASGTIVVTDVGGMTKAAVMTTNPSNGVTGALWIDNNGFNQLSQQVSISFDLNVIDAPTNATVQPKTLNGAGSVGILLGMNTFTGTSAPAARFAVAPTSAGGGVFAIRSPDNSDLQSFFNYVEGETYNVQLVSNYDTGKVSTYVNDAFQGEFSFWSGGGANISTSEFFFHLNGESGNANSVAVDNIVAAVPEPTGIALVAMGAGALLLRRRRHRAA
ncbi:MAG: PEP-CTERM sorting domain-containing protein [Tepidisphaeraceae bacterium]